MENIIAFCGLFLKTLCYNVDMTENNGDGIKKDSKVLMWVLIALLCIVIALVATIVIINLGGGGRVVVDNEDVQVCLDGRETLAVDECIEEKASEYLDEGDCDKALQLYEDVPAGGVDEDTLYYLYDQAYSTSTYCEDEEAIEYWRGKNNQFMNATEARD